MEILPRELWTDIIKTVSLSDVMAAQTIWSLSRAHHHLRAVWMRHAGIIEVAGESVDKATAESGARYHGWGIHPTESSGLIMWCAWRYGTVKETMRISDHSPRTAWLTLVGFSPEIRGIDYEVSIDNLNIADVTILDSHSNRFFNVGRIVGDRFTSAHEPEHAALILRKWKAHNWFLQMVLSHRAAQQ